MAGRDGDVTLSGAIDADGVVDATMVLDARVETIEISVVGERVEGIIRCALDATFVLAGGPAAGEEVDLEGSMELRR